MVAYGTPSYVITEFILTFRNDRFFWPTLYYWGFALRAFVWPVSMSSMAALKNDRWWWLPWSVVSGHSSRLAAVSLWTPWWNSAESRSWSEVCSNTFLYSVMGLCAGQVTHLYTHTALVCVRVKCAGLSLNGLYDYAFYYRPKLHWLSHMAEVHTSVEIYK